MKLFRSVLFWTHLTAGVLASAVILVMSFTGVVLALKPQIQEWIDRDVRQVSPQAQPRLSAHQLLTAVKEARPETPPQSLTLSREPDQAATVGIGRGNLFVNPYTGAILGTGSAAVNQFFQSMTSWHRTMGATGDYRAAGRQATGVSNLAFLLLAVTGLYIWWPKRLTLRHLKPILWFQRTSTGRARDFNWHNTIGFWCLIPIVIMTVSGAVISYTWAGNLVYRVTGSPVPAGRGGGPGGPGGAGGPRAEGRGAAGRGGPANGRGGEPQARVGERGREAGTRESPAGREGGGPGAAREAGDREGGGLPAARRGPESNQAPAIIPANLDKVWARAEQQVPTWSLLSMRLPNREDAPVAFTITDGANWNAFARSNLTVNSATAEVVQWQPYEAGSLGQKARGWLRFAHTGELGGITGQIVAGLGCLGGVFLVYTGLALAFRRLWNWALWKRVRSASRSPLNASSPATTRMGQDAVTE